MTIIPKEVLKPWYQMIGKNNTTYMAFIFGGVVVSEFIFGTVTEGMWNSANHGKLYASVDWSQFDEEEEEEEEEEE